MENERRNSITSMGKLDLKRLVVSGFGYHELKRKLNIFKSITKCSDHNQVITVNKYLL